VKRTRRADKRHEAPEEPRKVWIVVALDVAKREGQKILNKAQYQHIKEVLKRLVDFGNDEELSDLAIEPIASFWELKEKWGILGRINLRVYFGTFPEDMELVIAKTYKKEDDGKAPSHIIDVVEHRLEAYKSSGRKKSDSLHRKKVRVRK
jgi:hypothetical protein